MPLKPFRNYSAIRVRRSEQMKRYKLTAPDGTIYESDTPGLLGGNKRLGIYGRLNCPSANRTLKTYAKVRVFFADENAAIAAGYRPCGHCMRDLYRKWRAGGEIGTTDYPWLRKP